MTLHTMPTPKTPRWDAIGQRVLFEIRADGHRVPCAISLAALQELSPRPLHGKVALLTAFSMFHLRIDMAARDKLARRPLGVDGVLTIWADDLTSADDDPPPEQSPRSVARRIPWIRRA